eukprot:GDKI01009976.1.p1 GENE.GDKI01009976.1~~GDKI01009976.1.p1  ORF type:complete len:234 (+),score=43.48 GDKI01009976.1:96-704(+)
MKLVSLVTSLSADQITALIIASYLVFYSAYSKADGTFRSSLLWNILKFKNTHFSLREINKVISLAGLSLLGVAFLPGFKSQRTQLIRHACWQLWVHSVYSCASFYSCSFEKMVVNNPKAVAIGAGCVGQLALAGYMTGHLGKECVLWGGLGMGMAHFVLMESKNGKMQIRPFAYLPFFLASGAFGCGAYAYFKGGRTPFCFW